MCEPLDHRLDFFDNFDIITWPCQRYVRYALDVKTKAQTRCGYATRGGLWDGAPPLAPIGGTCRSRAEERGFCYRVLVAALLFMNKVGGVEETELEEEEEGGREGYQNPKRGTDALFLYLWNLELPKAPKREKKLFPWVYVVLEE